MSGNTEKELVFRGESGSECETFLYRIRKQGFSEGKHKDNDWMAGFASSCFQGDALRWHTELDPEVQHDWRLLQQALIKQYVSNTDAHTPSAFVPVPAASSAPPAAAPPPRRRSPSVTSSRRADSLGSSPDTPAFPFPAAAPPKPAKNDSQFAAAASPPPPPVHSNNANPASSPSTTQQRTGKLKMLCGENDAPYYIRAKLNGIGTFKRTSKASEGLQVLWDPVNEPNKLKLLVRTLSFLIPAKLTKAPGYIGQNTPGQTGDYFLGCTWDHSKNKPLNVQKGSKLEAFLSAVHGTDTTGQWAASTRSYSGPHRANIWNLNLDGSIVPMWIRDDGTIHEMDAGYHGMSKWVIVMADKVVNLGVNHCRFVLEEG